MNKKPTDFEINEITDHEGLEELQDPIKARESVSGRQAVVGVLEDTDIEVRDILLLIEQ